MLQRVRDFERRHGQIMVFAGLAKAPTVISVVVSETDGHEIHCFTDVEASKHNDLSEWHVDASGRESTRARSGAKPVVSIELDVLSVTAGDEFNRCLLFHAAFRSTRLASRSRRR